MITGQPQQYAVGVDRAAPMQSYQAIRTQVGATGVAGSANGSPMDSTLSYVGNGRGHYIQETQYKFVGDGRGEFDLVRKTPLSGRAPWICLCGLGCLGALLGLALWPLLRLSSSGGGDGGDVNKTERYDYKTSSARYDCQAGVDNWQAGWSIEKKHWCCQYRSIGCGHGLTTTTMHFNCQAGLSNWWNTWPRAKKVWCCVQENLGCPTTAPPPTSLPYDCDAGLNNWVLGWSNSKKGWCCQHFKKGCPPTPPPPPCDVDCSYRGHSGTCRQRITFQSRHTFSGPGACSLAVSAVVTICPGCATCSLADSGCVDPEPTTSLPYDCNAGYTNWLVGWSVSKKVWCCLHERKGCPPSTPLTTSAPYDCVAGYSKWQTGWSEGKKAWCCSNQHRGCQEQLPSTPPYDCLTGLANWQDGWSDGKKGWCCKNRQKGCSASGTTPFDCQAGLTKWVTGWSKAKKDWCCDHVGHGCPTVASSLPYDCLAGYANWQDGWSENKKRWCCTNHGRGCPSKI